MQREGCIEVRKGQDQGAEVHKTFNCIRGFLKFICLLNLYLFMSSIVSGDFIIQGASDFSIALNKASIVVCES